METNEKVILVRNGDMETIADHINSYAEVSNVEGGKKCPVELYKDSIGEHILLFPHNIPYAYFTSLLGALNAPWLKENGDMRAAGWAMHNDEALLLYTTSQGVVVAISNTAKVYVVEDDENTPVEREDENEKLPLEYFTYSYDKATLERVAVFELLIDDSIPTAKEDEPEVNFEEVAPQPQVPAKKLSPLMIVIAIVVVSALLIWLLSMAN